MPLVHLITVIIGQYIPRLTFLSAALLCIFAMAASARAQAQQLVTPTDIASATIANDFYPVANLFNDSGLNISPTIDNYTTVTHAPASGSTAWVTTAGGADYYANAANPSPVLTCALDGTYALTDMVVWGYHFGNPNNNEARDFTVGFSTDGGSSWLYPVKLSHVRTDENHDRLSFGATFSANAVRLIITDNHYNTAGASGGDRVGLGELKFIGESAPNPNPNILVTGAITFGRFTNIPPPQTIPLIITNLGNDLPLEVFDATISGNDAAHFSVTGAPLSIQSGNNGSLTVIFDPLGIEGCFVASLDIQSNDPESLINSLLLTASVNCTPLELDPPSFSIPEGTFIKPFPLTLTTTSVGAVIVYTTDGTRPAESNGLLYSQPIQITSTVQIRAATIIPGVDPALATHSYVRLASDLQQYSSGIPILIVENFGQGAIPDKGWTTSTQTGGGLRQRARQPSFMQIIEPDPQNGMASITGNPHLTSRIGIRVRGAYSSTWNPKPYSVETWDENDEDDSIKPLGLPSESDWILYFPHPSYDRTMLYNTFIWELASETGRYGTRFRFVDVFINEKGGDLQLSDRRGVYAFAEKVKRGNNRIDFKAISEDGTTGGWLLGINRMDPIPVEGFPTENGAVSPQFFHTPGTNRIAQTPPNTSGQGDDIPRQYNAFINFESPNGYRINAAQRSTIEDWFAEFENVFYDDVIWRDPLNGYRRYVNTRDVIDYFQLMNLGRQGDGLLLSIFPWVSSGDRKLHMGPMWDFNNGAYGGNATSTLYFRQDRLWYPRFFQDPDFLREYIDRWFQLRRGPLANDNMSAIIDRQAAQIPEALVPSQGLSVSSWNSRLASMKSWLSQRANWIDQQYFAPPTFNSPGGIVVSGLSLTISNSNRTPGTIYYTADGSDPIPAGHTTVTDTILTDQGKPAQALVPSVANGGSVLTLSEWSRLAPPPNDGNWISGTTGVGYDYAGLVGLDVSAMRNVNGSVYVRVPFTGPDQSIIDSWNRFVLQMKFEDGFIAYLNGIKIAEAGAPAVPAWDSLATAGSRPDTSAMSFVEFDLLHSRHLLNPGDNMLAIQAFNHSLSSSDLLCLPRLLGAEVIVPQPSLNAYTGPLTLTQSVTIKARTLSSSGEWSALNEATFVTGTPATSSNLVVSEIMYHPADPNPDAEYIELLNISRTDAIDLTGVQFTNGFDFTFTSGTTLAPGERVLVVYSLFAFEAVHGANDHNIAGEFTSGRLENGGETLRLDDLNGSAIKELRYNDKTPWPEDADGQGYSLVLVAPYTNLNPSVAANWRSSVNIAGVPGTSDATIFAGDPDEDSDLNGITDFVDYALGNWTAGNIAVPTGAIAPDGAFTFSYRQNLSADDAVLEPLVSDDLLTWASGETFAAILSSVHSGQGTITVTWQIQVPRLGHRFVRLGITRRP